jgi:putative redox protein
VHVEVNFPDSATIRARCKGLVVDVGLPPDRGGDPDGLGPFDILLCSLATCTGFHVLTFLEERGMSATEAGLSIEAKRNVDSHLLERVTLEIRVPKEFPDKYRAAIVRAAEACLIRTQLGQQPEFAASVVVADAAAEPAAE